MAMNIPAPVQILRATQAEIAERTGANGELNWAEDTHELYIHDGVTKGGHLIAGGGGGSYSAGAGVEISDDGVISVRLDDAFATAESNISNGIIGRSDIFVGNLDTLDSGYSNIRRYYKIDSFATGSKPFGNISFILVDLGLSQVAIAESKIAVRSRTSTNNPWPEWVMVSGTSVTAGDGISITGSEVAVDDTVIRTSTNQSKDGQLVFYGKADLDGINVNSPFSLIAGDGILQQSIYQSPRNRESILAAISIGSGSIGFTLSDDATPRYTIKYGTVGPDRHTFSIRNTNGGYIGFRGEVVDNEPISHAIARSTNDDPDDDEIITYDYFRNHAVTLCTGNIYVDNVNGSDSNDGLTADTALATFDAAIALRQKVKFYDPGSNDELITINLAASTTPYTYSKNTIPTNTAIVGAASDSTTLQLYSELKGVNTRLQFANITLDFVQISNLIVALLYFLTSTVSFSYCTIRKSTTSNIENLLYTGDSGYTYMENTAIDIGDNDNNFEQLIYTNNTSSIVMLSTTITGSGLISYSTVRCNSISNIFINGLNSTSASLNAKRYDATLGSGICVNNAGENAIPGTLPGSVDDTSWYK